MIRGAAGSETPETEGTLVELSADGARLASPVPLEIQDQVLLSLGEEIGLAEPIAAEVRWSRRAQRNGFLVGCAFACHLPDELLDELLAEGILDDKEPARHGVSGEADGWKELNPTALHVRLVDLSRGGLSVISPQPAKIGQRLRLVIQEADHEPVEILGSIRWQGETQAGFLLGCQFEHEEYYHRIRDLVCPAGARGNGKDRRSSKTSSSQRGLGWLKRLWKHEEEDLVVSASLRDLRALAASAQGESNMPTSDSQEPVACGASESQGILDECSAAIAPCGPEDSPHEVPSHDAPATDRSEQTETVNGAGDESAADEFAAFERRFRELQALARQGTEDPFAAPPAQEPSEAQATVDPVSRGSLDSSSGGMETAEPARRSDENASSLRPETSGELESEPSHASWTERFEDANEGYGASTPARTSVLKPLTSAPVESTEHAALEELLSETAALRERQEQFAVELQRCEERLERLGRQFAQQQQPQQQQQQPASRTVTRVRRHRRRRPILLGLRLALLVLLGAACWSWFVPGPLSTLLHVSDWRSLLGPRLGHPTITGDDEYTVEEDGTLNVPAPGVFVNDRTGAGRSRALLVRGPEHGTLQLGADGSFQYTPHADFHGTDRFAYKGEDRADDRGASTVQIRVTPVNDRPVSRPDAYTIGEDQTLSVALPGVLANDVDADGESLSTVLSSDPEHGTVSLKSDGGFEYTPHQDFHGTDHFTYKTGDGTEQSEAATVTITVAPANDAPLATPDSFSTVEDNPLRVAAPGVLSNDRDVENDPLTASVLRGPEHGTLTLSPDGSFRYLPHTAFSGTDRFTYEVRDASSAATGTVTIAVIGTNDAPTSTGIVDVIDPDTTKPVSIDLGGVFHDADGDPLTYTVVSNSAADWVAATIVDSATLELHFASRTPGTSELRVRATDAAGEFAEETVRVKVPSASHAVNGTGPEPSQPADGRLAALSAAIERAPQNAESWKARARRYEELGRWQEAAQDYSEALALNPLDRGAWSDRGAAHAESGEWQQAQSDFAQAIAIAPDARDTAYLAYLQALAALGGNDLEAYRSVCAQSVRRLAGSVDGTSTLWTAWTCALVPEATADFRRVIARTEAMGDRGNAFATVASGALYYRAGRPDRALERLEGVANRAAGSGPLPYDWFFLAMTYQRLGRKVEAEQWLARASQASGRLGTHGRDGEPLSWNQALTLEVLRREAEATLQRVGVP